VIEVPVTILGAMLREGGKVFDSRATRKLKTVARVVSAEGE